MQYKQRVLAGTNGKEAQTALARAELRGSAAPLDQEAGVLLLIKAGAGRTEGGGVRVRQQASDAELWRLCRCGCATCGTHALVAGSQPLTRPC